jgi:hypothetical protein
MKHPGTAEGVETVGGSPGSSEFSSGRGSAEMICNGCPYANGEVLVKGVGENLLPTTQGRGLGRPGPPVPAPSARYSQTDLFCYLSPVRAP